MKYVVFENNEYEEGLVQLSVPLSLEEAEKFCEGRKDKYLYIYEFVKIHYERSK